MDIFDGMPSSGTIYCKSLQVFGELLGFINKDSAYATVVVQWEQDGIHALSYYSPSEFEDGLLENGNILFFEESLDDKQKMEIILRQ